MTRFRTHSASLIVLGCGLAFVVAYASGATAPAMWPTLMKATTPHKSPDAEGFIPRWLILEPIPVTGLTEGAVRSMLKKEYFPDQFNVMPQDGDKVTVNGSELSWHALDTKNYNVNLYHFANVLGKPTSDVLFWAVTVVNSPVEVPNVRLAIGSNAASVWWLNGKEVASVFGDRQTVIDDGVSKRLTLNKGRNVLRAVIVNGGGATDFCARFLDSNDKPFKSLTITTTAAK